MGGNGEEETKRQLPKGLTSNVYIKTDNTKNIFGGGGGKTYVLPLSKIECKFKIL